MRAFLRVRAGIVGRPVVHRPADDVGDFRVRHGGVRDTGESSGNLDKALDNISSYYSDVVPRRIKTVFSILEPALMLFLIFMVGCVALAIYMPIISLMGAIKG